MSNDIKWIADDLSVEKTDTGSFIVCDGRFTLLVRNVGARTWIVRFHEMQLVVDRGPSIPVVRRFEQDGPVPRAWADLAINAATYAEQF